MNSEQLRTLTSFAQALVKVNEANQKGIGVTLTPLEVKGLLYGINQLRLSEKEYRDLVQAKLIQATSDKKEEKT